VRAVEHLSFECAAGEVVGLLGPNGAGKTTTLRILATILQPTEGRVSVAGHDAATSPEARAPEPRLRVGVHGRVRAALGARDVSSTYGRLHGNDARRRLARRRGGSPRFLEMHDFADRLRRADSRRDSARQVSLARG